MAFSPARLPNWPGGQNALTQAPNPVDDVTVGLLMTALAAAPLGNDRLVQAVTGTMTVGQFKQATGPNRLAFINALWDALATAHAFTTRWDQMTDSPHAAPTGTQPLPSSWCPTAKGATTYRKRAGGQPWRELGVGFRVDGGDQGAVNRVIGQGMTQQRLNESFMVNFRGQKIGGTTLDDDTQARVWTGNHDIFNETAVCVSRNFFGATAFPERTTDHRGSEYSLLWAVSCLGLTGFDTEGYQLGLPGARQWRPGEKAFRVVPRDRVLGYVKIHRRGAAATGGWSFDIADDANWTICGTPTVRQRQYMMDELSAWRGRHVIPAQFDFAT
jgi:hypothetical protein